LKSQWDEEREVEMYRAPVKPGRIIFEMGDISPEIAREAFERASYKLPLKTKILSRTDF
jgi:large subunit ribosomal protein L16